ncbi:cell division protein SepF [Demequina sp.]|uniref:cell division protein SepF n=1 Tax=Demequina sp. TaxID=2050685 RepID=UPI003D0A8A8F
MSAVRKMAQYLGFDVADNEQYDYTEDELAPVTNLHDVSEVRSHAKHAAPEPERANPAALRRIQTLNPKSYSDARIIGEAFRVGVPVIMNLSAMNDADAKRLVDFSAGLTFGLQGTLERIATSVFLLSPKHVHVAVDEQPQRVETGFYDQA